MSRKGSIVIVLVLALALCAAGAAPALPLALDEAPSGTGLLSGLWDRFLDWIGQVAAAGIEGCHLDPNGGLICD